MDNIDRSFLAYRRRKVYGKILFFSCLVFLAALFTWIYIYEWNRMPDVIYVEEGEEQIIDFQIPARGEIYKESVETGAYGQEAVESLSFSAQEPKSLSVDFSKEVVFSGVEDEIYLAELKLFGVLPYKTVRIESVEPHYVIPSGQPIGIYVKMDGVYVIDTGEFTCKNGEIVAPCRELLQTNDYIIAVNGEAITRKKDFMELVNNSNGEIIHLTVVRGEETLYVSVQPMETMGGIYKIGAWVRDSLQGVGTMTFIDENGSYGALGHAVRDADTNELVDISGGALFETSILSIRQGEKGEPGEITGLIQYEQDKKIGDVMGNTLSGIYGMVTKDDWVEETSWMEIGLKQEIKEEEAYILSGISGEVKAYEVEIIEINYNNSEKKRALTIQVTDEELLEMTGGIVQGMSGSPIIQDGKVIGAVTHVLVNDPTKGYGIFIEEMLEHN